MLGVNVVNTDSFMLFEITDEDGTKVDGVSITKYYPYNVLNFYRCVEDYIEEYSHTMSALIEKYEGRIDFDKAIEERGNAEFELYRTVMGL